MQGQVTRLWDEALDRPRKAVRWCNRIALTHSSGACASWEWRCKD